MLLILLAIPFTLTMQRSPAQARAAAMAAMQQGPAPAARGARAAPARPRSPMLRGPGRPLAPRSGSCRHWRRPPHEEEDEDGRSWIRPYRHDVAEGGARGDRAARRFHMIDLIMGENRDRDLPVLGEESPTTTSPSSGKTKSKPWEATVDWPAASRWEAADRSLPRRSRAAQPPRLRRLLQELSRTRSWPSSWPQGPGSFKEDANRDGPLARAVGA